MKRLLVLIIFLMLCGSSAEASSDNYTVSGKMNPKAIGSLDLSQYLEWSDSMLVQGDYLWVSGYMGRGEERRYRACAIDISDPTNPKTTSVQEFPEKRFIKCIKGNLQYRTLSVDKQMILEVVDVSDVNNPKVVKVLDVFDGSHGNAVVAENYLVVAVMKIASASQTKMYLFDISIPDNPRLICDKVTDLKSGDEYNSIMTSSSGIESRENIIYLLGWDNVYFLGIQDEKLYLIDEMNSQIDFIAGITIVPETMVPMSVYQYMAGKLRDDAPYPWEVDPENRTHVTHAAIQIISHENEKPLNKSQWYFGASGQIYKLPLDHAVSVQSNKTLAYVTGVIELKVDDPKEIALASKMLVLDLSRSSEPKIIGEYDFKEVARIACQSGDLSFIMHRSNLLEVVKLPISDQEFNNVFYSEPGDSGMWDPFNPQTVVPKGIEELLRIEIGKKTGELTSNDFRDVRKLELYFSQLTSLDGIELCTNLEELNLESNYIEDITPLASLSKLKVLKMDRCRVKDLEPLSRLENLQILNLKSNRFTDITPLIGLTRLEELNISDNRGYTLAPIAQIKSLKKLDMSGTGQKDLSSLSELKNLTELDISFNRLENIKPLVNLDRLETLDISSNYITDFSALVSLESLGNLTVCNHKLQDISFLRDIKKLESLNLNNNRITDLSPLAGLTNLEYLNLGENRIAEISPPAGLKNLKTLKLDENEISDVSPLTELTSLENLNLDTNKLTDIHKLGSLVNLKDNLSINDNRIASLDGLQNLVKLEKLFADKNELTNISEVSGLKNLILLSAMENKISDLTPLQNMESLELLLLDRNSISEISPLAKIRKLKSVSVAGNQIMDISSLMNNDWGHRDIVITLKDNPIYDQPKETWVPQLMKSGVILGPDDSEQFCVYQLIGLSECANTFKIRNLDDRYGNLIDIRDANMAPPNAIENNLIREYTIALWEVTPSKKKSDGSIEESTLKIVVVPASGKEHRIFAITEEMIVMEWIGDYIPDDFSTVSMTDEKLWKKWPSEFYSGDREI